VRTVVLAATDAAEKFRKGMKYNVIKIHVRTDRSIIG
jgi:hypothetical protein